MVRVLVSACLLGERVRYNGADVAVASEVLSRWLAEGRVVSLCPEVAAGLGVPRPPAEIRNGRVVTPGGEDLSEAFHAGARRALVAAREAGARVAVLKEGSPSCGSSWIYDGSFRGHRVAGAGVTAALLRAAGIAVFSEAQIEEADRCLRQIEGGL